VERMEVRAHPLQQVAEGAAADTAVEEEVVASVARPAEVWALLVRPS